MTRKEASISRGITNLLKQVGFAVWSTEQGFRKERGGTRTTPGFPDLVAIGHGRIVFIEVKGPKGKLRESQELFRDECLANGGTWFMWRDEVEAFDWLADIGVIEV